MELMFKPPKKRHITCYNSIFDDPNAGRGSDRAEVKSMKQAFYLTNQLKSKHSCQGTGKITSRSITEGNPTENMKALKQQSNKDRK